ncbi:hypothetical protein [Membranihabitans maritimus]|uniref:hypothetical protein n=1 Tax=Membranihabitans maritimus TaxID=2904244 RepID=UPI001F1F7DFD|nr:hypothetical protein [Membranihabitans maritimus]
MILLFIIILSSLFIFRPAIYSQDTSSLEWAPEGATWHYNFFSVLSQTVSSLKMTATKDTVVNGKDARIIEGEIYLYNGDTAVATDYYEQGRIVIHQQGDSIFYLRENKFEILYDFSMEEGDTMRIVTPAPYDPDASSVQDTFIYVTLESTGTIEINGEILRTQKLKNFFPVITQQDMKLVR